MKKLLGFILPLIFLTSIMLAVDNFDSPTDKNGRQAKTIDWVGSKILYKTVTSTYAPAFNGAGILYGIIMTSTATVQYVTFCDSGTAGGSTTSITPRIYFDTIGKTYTFPKPIKVNYGVTYQTSYDGEADVDTVGFIYRLKSDN